jgi:putative ABC transport system substrate-binding protein
MRVSRLKRREFITLLGSAAAWPVAARAQQRPTPLIGFLNSLSREGWLAYLAAFHQGLKEAGYVDGQNVTIEYRWADGHYDRLPMLAVDLVRRHVDLIVATGGNPSALAAKAATTTPIVFIAAGDPVKEGFVASLNRPGGNMTGVSIITTSLEAKRLELLHDLIPDAVAIAVLLNPNFSEAETQLKVVQIAAERLGQQIRVLNAGSEAEIDRAFAELIQHRTNALLVASDPFFFGVRDKLVGLAARYAIPTIYFVREFTMAGGLMSYGASLSRTYHQMGVYSGRILKGDKPADLPVEQPTRFELVLNLKTAKALGLSVPQTLQVTAEEVIE